ncbi:MAG: hypothetical protein ACI4GY_09935 [Acutalibacteraceae bacterium]
MNQKTKQILAVILAVIILFTGGFALGMTKSISIGVNVNSQGGEIASVAQSTAAETATPTAAPTTQTPTVQPTSAATEAATTSAASSEAASTPEQSSADVSQAATSEASSKPEEQASAGSSDMSTEQIVELYNSSVNRVKPEATTIVRNYQKLESLPEYLELPSAVQGIGSAAIKQFVKGSDEPQTWTTKEDFELGFPVGGTDYSSHMTPDMVESATCTDNGSTYQLEIKLYDDKITSPEKGAGYAGVFNTVTADSITSVSIPGVTFNSVDVNGINGSISCTIDKTSKHVTEITFRNADILSIDAKVIVSVQAKMALANELNFTISY